MLIDDGKAQFDVILNKWASSLDSIDNEANTRFKLIDEIFKYALGWESLGEYSLEKYLPSGYADYVLSVDQKDRLVVEAKRSNRVLINSSAQNTQYLSADSAVLKDAQDGLRQAQFYCVDTGVLFAALTNGVEWIAYWAVRENGKKPSEGKVVLFPSLAAIQNDFAQFWDLFSRQGVIEQRFKVRIREAEGLRVQSAEMLTAVLRTRDYKYLEKSKFITDLDVVFKRFFSSMAGDDDPEMLVHCFVESKESKEADVTLGKIAFGLVERLEIMSSESGQELQEKMETAVEFGRGEFVLIIGNKGAGKSTFIERFFKLVLPPGLRNTCTVARIDVADSAGDVATICDWLDRQVLSALESALFTDGIATYDQLQGIFFAEYQRWIHGPHRVLYETDKTEFKIKFGEYLEVSRNNDLHHYIGRLLNDVVTNRKKMPCLVFDNTDHFDEAFQEKVFQYAQSLFRASFSFVICPITDRTIWKLSKHGPFQSYESTALYLPVPAMKSVLEKRVSFIRSKLQGKTSSVEPSQYFLKKGIRLSLQNIDAFAACVEEIFISSDGISRTIGGLTNFDVRRSLQLSQKITTSPHIKIDDLVRMYLTTTAQTIKLRLIHSAILCGDSNHYAADSNHFVNNIFEVKGDQLSSPLLGASLLKFFADIDSHSDGSINAAHASLTDVIDYFDSMGIGSTVLRRSVERLANAHLLAAFDSSEQLVVDESRFRITPSGKIHLEWVLGNESYMQEMALTTPLRSCERRDELSNRWHSTGKKDRDDWLAIAKLFATYALEQDSLFISVPNMEGYRGQLDMRTQFSSRWLQRLDDVSTRIL
jgi:energy-coupling factor transporter ATP-binding protein EcfA2